MSSFRIGQALHTLLRSFNDRSGNVEAWCYHDSEVASSLFPDLSLSDHLTVMTTLAERMQCADHHTSLTDVKMYISSLDSMMQQLKYKYTMPWFERLYQLYQLESVNLEKMIE